MEEFFLKLTEIFKRILKMLDKKQKVYFGIIVLIMIVSSYLSQLTPLAIGNLTDGVLGGSEETFYHVIPYLLFILIVCVCNEFIKVIRRILVEDTCTRTEKRARFLALNALLKAPMSYFKENMVGNIHGKLNRSLEGTIRLLKLMFMDFAPAIFNSVAAIIVIYSQLPFYLDTLMMLVIPVGVLIVFCQIKTQKGIRVELLETKSKMDGNAVELINGIEVIRVSNTADDECNKFDCRSEYLREKEMKHHKAMAKYDCLKFINESVFTVLIIGVSVYLAAVDVITVGSILTSYLCFTQLLTPLKELHRILDELSESMVLANEYFKISDIPNDFSYQVLGKKNMIDKDSKVILEVENLDFSYSNDKHTKKILDHLNLEIRRGEFVGIAGPSGCGKSSFIKVITKLEAAKGNVFIDEFSISKLSRKNIADLIALVPQVPFLVSGTIRDNICYGLDRKVSDTELEKVCEKAYILDFIKSLDDGFDSMISEGGSNLSGGQKQRIAIARIFLRKPKILILDEATSALDNTSEKHIQKEIERWQKEENITVISIAHRLTTLKNCDRILVFNEGKIEQFGKYDELIKIPGIFKDMNDGVLK